MTRAGRPRLLLADPSSPDPAALAAAAAALRQGGVVAFPTETFYGLGAAARLADAVRRVFALKGRPADKPVLVLVDGPAMAESVAEVTDEARGLMARHWPGALTLVLRARPTVPDEVTAGTGTLGVRLSPHAIARGLVATLGEPVIAPSANPSGLEPPTSAAAVLGYFGDALDVVLDGGPTPGGAPSTVLDLTVTPPRVLRYGAVRLQ